MPDLLRTFTVRNPVVLPQRQIEAMAIHTHPPNFQSPRYRRWLTLCKVSDREALQAEIVSFLRSGDSVKQTSDLGAPWSAIADRFLVHGPAIDRDAALSFLGESMGPAPRSGDCNFFGVRTNLADTILALAIVKHLGDPSNVDYLSMLRILELARRAEALEMRLPETSIGRHFDRPVLLPFCFFGQNRCEEKTPDAPFPFLSEVEQERKRKRTRGCASDGDCKCKVNDECVEQNRSCATVRPYVVDLMVVRDSTRCYQAGDLSFIKNVLAGETLSTRHRRLERIEELVEREDEQTRNTERDLQIDDKASLHREISDTVKSDLSTTAGITASAKWGSGATYELNATASFSYSKSKEEAHKETRDISRDVIDRSVAKLEEKVRTLARTTRTVETEETNEHGFTNAGGPNVSGQYLYVNKISRAQVFNYGRKAVLDLFLPEPAALYIKLLSHTFDGVAPVAPKKLDVTADTITPDNYSALATQFGLKDVPVPPPFHTVVEVTLEAEPGDPKGKKNKSGSHTYSFSCVIPNDYAGVSMSVHSVRLNYNEGGGVSIGATLGPNGDTVWHQDGGSSSFSSSLPSIEGNNTVVVHTWDVTNFTWILTVACDLKPEAKAKWQNEVFAKIEEAAEKAQAAYEQALQKYLDQKKAFDEREEAQKLERYNRNPFINRETERTELKRLAISYVSCQFFEEFDAMKNRVKPCGYPQMDIEEAQEEGRIVQFFEEAFDWTLMTWQFYSYMWARMCTWPEKLEVESGDLIFQQFLSAGSARVLIPIRDGFFDYVQYFLATGEIWGSNGVPPVPGDPHYVSMAQEIREQKGNYYADREGHVDVVNGSNVVTLNGSDWYWTYADLLNNVPAGLNTVNVAADIDREIILDCKVYRILDIRPNPNVGSPTSWLLTIDRNYEGDTAQKLLWSTGAVYIGAPWEFVTPTMLTFLRDRSACLPCYPLEECKEKE